MSDRKTGATDAQIEAAAIRRFETFSALRHRGWDGVRAWFRDRQRTYMYEWAQWLVPPDQRIVPAALVDEVKALRKRERGLRRHIIGLDPDTDPEVVALGLSVMFPEIPEVEVPS